jgi:hypothetical protein
MLMMFTLHSSRITAVRADMSYHSRDRFIFPDYIKALWACGLSLLGNGLITLAILDSATWTGSVVMSISYGVLWGVFRISFDGITFLLLCDGVGSKSYQRAIYFSTVWAVVTGARECMYVLEHVCVCMRESV